MLRSLYSGISGLRSHQTMLDVTGNNIANVNTAGFKGSTVRFQDTLSQLTQGAAAGQGEVGGTNPAQVGLGVQVAAISTNFTQGSPQSTGLATDLMISGDGFFVTRMAGETLYTRAGSFDFDSKGRLVDPSGALVQGWGAVNGTIMDRGAIDTITLPLGAVSPAVATTSATMIGNLPEDAADGTELVRDLDVFNANGDSQILPITFTRSAGAWTVSDGTTNYGTLTFNDGVLAGPGSVVVAGVTLDVSKLTGFSGLSTAAISGQDGRKAGDLDSFTMSKDGTLVGSFSNGALQSVGRVSLATFVNPGGLEKAGSSSYRATFNSGAAEVGTAGAAGFGMIVSGSLEMSNVDLSQEFTNLIVAQRGFQANARIITTSDEVLQELTNLKR
jgi:flagellar hook protein FlgE